MPKIIKDLEQSIFNSALKLFGEYGYEKVDMKMIAKDVGIAVGTLYNYYPNKKELFINVFINSWKKTFLKLDYILERNGETDEKTVIFISTLYEDISDRKGLGMEISRLKDFSESELHRIIEVKQEIYEKIGAILLEYNHKNNVRLDKDTETRLIETVLTSITSIIRNHPEERHENISFLIKLLSFGCRN